MSKPQDSISLDFTDNQGNLVERWVDGKKYHQSQITGKEQPGMGENHCTAHTTYAPETALPSRDTPEEAP